MRRKEEAGPIDQAAGARLRAVRNLRNMSQTALGDAIGITFQQIQKYERGTNRMAISTVHALCKALDCALEDIIPPLDVPAVPVSVDIVAERNALAASVAQIAKIVQSARRTGAAIAEAVH